MVVLKTNTNLQFVWNKTEHACAICSTPIVIKISVTSDPNFIQVRTNVCQNVLAAGRTYFCFGRNTIRIILSLIFSKQTDKITPIQPIPTPVQHSSSHTYTLAHLSSVLFRRVCWSVGRTSIRVCVGGTVLQFCLTKVYNSGDVVSVCLSIRLGVLVLNK